ncbi:hypothetical protein NQ185_14045 [Lederbergia panacisoli]|nr:hypothetical protein [Lederbergia panacisoli]
MSNYEEFYTKAWHGMAPETRGFVVCSVSEATHVVFSETDLRLAGKDGENLSNNRVYPITKTVESADYSIIDDKGQVIIGFDLFIPCEYLKENHGRNIDKRKEEYTTKIVSLLEYKIKRKYKNVGVKRCHR